MLETETLYVISQFEAPNVWGWSPDGEGMYYYDNLSECELDNPDVADWPVHYFHSPREFDDFRYGPV